VNPGSRRVSAFKKDHAFETKIVMVAGGETGDVALDGSMLGTPKTAPALLDSADLSASAASESVQRSSSAGKVISLTATGALAAAAGVFCWLAIDAKRTFDRALDTIPIAKQKLDDDRQKMKRYALLTDGFAGAAVLAAGFSVYYLVRGEDSSPTPKHASVRLMPTLGGVVLNGAW
jgi:hypothetical protein